MHIHHLVAISLTSLLSIHAAVLPSSKPHVLHKRAIPTNPFTGPIDDFFSESPYWVLVQNDLEVISESAEELRGIEATLAMALKASMAEHRLSYGNDDEAYDAFDEEKLQRLQEELSILPRDDRFFDLSTSFLESLTGIQETVFQSAGQVVYQSRGQLVVQVFDLDHSGELNEEGEIAQEAITLVNGNGMALLASLSQQHQVYSVFMNTFFDGTVPSGSVTDVGENILFTDGITILEEMKESKCGRIDSALDYLNAVSDMDVEEGENRDRYSSILGTFIASYQTAIRFVIKEIASTPPTHWGVPPTLDPIPSVTDMDQDTQTEIIDAYNKKLKDWEMNVFLHSLQMQHNLVAEYEKKIHQLAFKLLREKEIVADGFENFVERREMLAVVYAGLWAQIMIPVGCHKVIGVENILVEINALLKQERLRFQIAVLQHFAARSQVTPTLPEPAVRLPSSSSSA